MQGQEREDTPYLSEEEIKKLEGHPHVFDYSLSEEQKVKSGYRILLIADQETIG